MNLLFLQFHSCDLAAKALFSASVVRTDPVVISSESMNDNRPVRMVETDQAGFHEPGWKSEKELQILRSGCAIRVEFSNRYRVGGGLPAKARLAGIASVNVAYLKATTWREHLDSRRSEWIVCSEEQHAVILASGIRRVIRTSHDEVAFETAWITDEEKSVGISSCV